jgi:hypothetical protein
MYIEPTVIALEAFSASDVTSLFSKAIPAFIKEAAGFTSEINPETPKLLITPQQADFIKEVNKYPYFNIGPLAAYVPEGLNVTYLEYTKELIPAANHAANILTGMTAYSTFLSQLITNHDQRLSTTSFERTYTQLANERNKLNSALGNCFKKGGTVTQRSLATVVDRNKDWAEVFHACLLATKQIDSVDRIKLNKKVQECKSLLEIVIRKIENKELDDMSPNVIRNLADGAFQIASELEFFSVTYYKVLAFTTSVNRTVEHFYKVLEEK